MLQMEAGKAYNNYGVINCSLLGTAADGSPAEVEAYHRACLERRMYQVVDLVSRMAEVVGTAGDDQDSVNMEANVQHSLAGASGACMAKVIQGIATRLEDAVAKVVAPPQAVRATMDGTQAPHATVIKQVCHVHRKLDVAKQVYGASPENYWQPYLGVAVT